MSATNCACGHPHVLSVGDGADAGCQRIGHGCECWEWHEAGDDCAWCDKVGRCPHGATSRHGCDLCLCEHP